VSRFVGFDGGDFCDLGIEEEEERNNEELGMKLKLVRVDI
jgi:hypothetical protein